MLFGSDVRTSRFDDLAQGAIILVTDDQAVGATLAVTAEFEDGKVWAFNVETLDRVAVDDDEPVLEVLNTVVRFDPASALPLHALPPKGSLIFLDEGKAIYQPSDRRPQDGVALFFNGDRINAARNGAPAFTHWELGLDRGHFFEVLVSVCAPSA